MSVQAYSYAMSVTRYIPSRTVQSLLAHLADHADRFGRHAFPAVPTLAEALHCSDCTVQRGLRWLQEQGYIRRSSDLRKVSKLPHYKRPTVYEISLSEETRIEFADEYAASKTGSPYIENDMNPPPDTAMHVTGPVTPVASKPSYKPSPLSPDGDSSPWNDEDLSNLAASSQEHEQHRDDNMSHTSTTVANDPEAFVIRFAAILTAAGVEARKPRRSDRRAAGRLLERHDSAELLDLVAWVAKDGFWRGKMLAVRALERRYEELRLHRLHRMREQEDHAVRRRGVVGAVDRNRGGEDSFVHRENGRSCDANDVAISVSSATVYRCPVFGYRELSHRCAEAVALAHRHLDGLAPVGECPVCAHDERNVSLHGGNRSDDAIRAARDEIRRATAARDETMIEAVET